MWSAFMAAPGWELFEASWKAQRIATAPRERNTFAGFLDSIGCMLFAQHFRRIPGKDYSERIVSAVCALRRKGLPVGLPLRTVEGIMFFQVDDDTLTASQILELLDKDQLNREGIRAFAEAQKK